MRKNSLVFGTIFILVMVLLITTSVFAGSVAQSGDKTVTIGVVVPSPDHAWLAAVSKSAQQAAKGIGSTCNMLLLNSSADPASQIAEVESMITKRVDVLVLLPVEGGPLTPICSEVKKAGIFLVNVDRGIASFDYDLKIEGDNFLIGYNAGEWIAKRLKGKGKVAELSGIPGLSIVKERGDGFRAAIKKYPGIELVASQHGHFVVEKGMKATEDILTAHPKLDAIFSQSDSMAIGAIQAIKAAGRTKEIIMTGMDGNLEVFKIIKADNTSLKATCLYPPIMMASAVNLAYLAAQGRGLSEMYEKDLPVHIKVKSSVVTKENVDKFWSMGF